MLFGRRAEGGGGFANSLCFTRATQCKELAVRCLGSHLGEGGEPGANYCLAVVTVGNLVLLDPVRVLL